jgi:hypothetical protein
MPTSAAKLLCGDCKAKTLPPVPWEALIRRHNKHAILLL